MEQQPHHISERFKNKNKIKSRHIQIGNLAHKKNAMVSLKDGVTVWRWSQKKDFLSMIIVRTPFPAFLFVFKGGEVKEGRAGTFPI